MANYPREFLIPYLKDIHALHLALEKLQDRLDQLKQQKRSLERGSHFRAHPQTPCYEAANGGFFIGLGAFSFMCALPMFGIGRVFAGIFCILIGSMEITIGTIRYVQVSRENTQKEKQYSEKLAAYHAHQRKNDSQHSAIPALVDEIQLCEAEIQRAEDTLQQIYSANIIPEPYRQPEAAAFLYTWFRTGNADDLDTACKVFSLIEANRLDQTVADQSEAILQEYCKLTDENLNSDPAMPESRTATEAYFAAANYLRGL